MITQKKLDRRKRRKASSRGDGSGRKQSAGSSVPQEPDPPSSHSSVRRGQASPRNNNNDSRGERTPRTEYASPSAANGSNGGGERNVETPVLTPHPVHYLAQQRRLQEQQSWTPRGTASRNGNTGQDGVGSRGSSSIGHTAHLTPVSGRVIVAPLAQSMNFLMPNHAKITVNLVFFSLFS